MAANEEFPRGWVLTNVQNATGVAASVTVSAIPGVIRVIDKITAKIASTSQATGQIPLITLDGVTVAFLAISSTGVNVVSTDEVVVPGPIGANLGAARTVAFSSILANTVETLIVEGHDA